MTISIVLCFADSLSSAGIEALLGHRDGLKVVDAQPGGDSAVEAVRAHRPDVVLGDRNFAESTEADEIAQLSKVIVISSGERPDEDMRWVARGISAVLGEQTTPETLASAVEVVAAGSYLVVPAALAPRLARSADGLSASSPAPESALSQRETEVLRLLANGLSNVDIANKLFVSDSTVRSHIHHMLRKLGVRSRTQAVSVAYRSGLLSPSRDSC